MKESIDKNGLIGLFMGGFTACAVGVSAALIFSYFASLKINVWMVYLDILISEIKKKEPDLEINNIGEADFIITFKNKPGSGLVWQWCKIIFVGLAAFFGAGFSIMTFNNDVDVGGLFSQIYTQVTGQTSGHFTVLEITYSIGIGLGVLFFFNHFGHMKITDDPTPMQIQMLPKIMSTGMAPPKRLAMIHPTNNPGIAAGVKNGRMVSASEKRI